MVIGVLQLELHIPESQSLKDKRSALKRLREQLRSRFNVAVAELEANDTWQRARIGVAAVGDARPYVEELLREVTSWARHAPLVALSRAEESYFESEDE